MSERTVRIGKVSSVDYKHGMMKVTYPDLDDLVTDDLPYLTFNDEYKMPKIGAEVAVLHLSNGTAAGIVLGTYWNEIHTPPKYGKEIYRKDFAQKIGEAIQQYTEEKLLLTKAPKQQIETDKDLKLKAGTTMTLDAQSINLSCSAGTISVAEIISHIKG